MFENIMNFFKKFNKKDEKVVNNSKEAAKERLHLVLMQDRANVSADFLELMKQEIIEVIKKYIDVDEKEIDVRLTNKENADGTNGAPALYANIPILNIKNEARKINAKDKEEKENENKETSKSEDEKEQKEETKKIKENGETVKKIIKKKERPNQTNKEEKTEKEDITQTESKLEKLNKDGKEENKQEEMKKKQEENKQEKTTKEKTKFKN